MSFYIEIKFVCIDFERDFFGKSVSFKFLTTVLIILGPQIIKQIHV